MTGLVVCSHGTRSRVGAERVSALVGAVSALLPRVDVREAHVDVHRPFVGEVLRPGDVVVPLLLAPGFHVVHDIGAAATRVSAAVTPPFGPDPTLTEVLADRVSGVGLEADDVLVLAAAGSSVPAATHEVRRQAGSLARRLQHRVLVGFGTSSPLLPELVARLRRSGASRRLVAASYLLTPGHFQDQVLAAGFDAVTTPLLDAEPDPRLVELVIRRFEGAAARGGQGGGPGQAAKT